MIEKTEDGPLEATERKYVSPRKRDAIALRQDWKCADCGCLLLPLVFHIDHILPLDLGGADSEENYQALCPGCHERKTRLDMKRILKARRIRRTLAGEKPQRGKKLRGRGFGPRDPLHWRGG